MDSLHFYYWTVPYVLRWPLYAAVTLCDYLWLSVTLCDYL